MSRAPALEALTWQTDELEVTALPGIGCRLHRVRAFGVDVLRTPDVPERHVAEPFFWGAYVMAPWTNRADPAPMTIAGRDLALAANFPDGTAIHGLVHERAWERIGETSFRVTPEPGGWPWRHEVAAAIELAGARLRLTYRLTNRDDGPMPGGIGLHPWFLRPLEIALPARRVHPDNAARDVAPVPAEGRFALHGGRPADGLDATWLDVQPGVALRWPAAGIGAQVTLDGDGPVHVAVASPPSIPAVAVEPVTHAPWALRRLANGEPDGMRLLGPGEALALVITVDFTREVPARTHLAAEDGVWLNR